MQTVTEEPEDLARETGLVVMVPKGQDGLGTTHAGNRYDHFLISRDLADEEAVRCEIRVFDSSELGVAKGVSDHMPVEAWFRTDEGFRDRK